MPVDQVDRRIDERAKRALTMQVDWSAASAVQMSSAAVFLSPRSRRTVLVVPVFADSTRREHFAIGAASPKISYLQLHATSHTRPAASTSLLYLVLPSRLALKASHTALARGMRRREPAGHACPHVLSDDRRGGLTQDQLPAATRHKPYEAIRVHITAVSCPAFQTGP